MYCWYPVQCPALTIANVATVQSANTTYSTNEQTMLNNLKTDVTNIHSELLQLYNNLKNAGYSL